MRAEAAVALVNGGVQTEERLDVLRFEDIGLGERRLFDIKEHPPYSTRSGHVHLGCSLEANHTDAMVLLLVSAPRFREAVLREGSALPETLPHSPP